MDTTQRFNESDLGNLTPLTSSPVADLCDLCLTPMTTPHLVCPGPPEYVLDEESLLNRRDFLMNQLLNLDCYVEADLVEPADDFTDQWMRDLAALQSRVSQLCVDSAECAIVIDECLDAAIDLQRQLPHLNFSLSDDDIDLPSCYTPPPVDLTTEGVEPNPGPFFFKVEDPASRSNRYRVAANSMTKRQRRDIKREIALHDKMLRDAQMRKIKTSSLGFDCAQIGGEVLQPILSSSSDNPPPECKMCGRMRCDCLIKKLTTTATVFSIAQSLVKIIDILSHWMTVNHAQMGVTSWMFGAQPTIDAANTLLNDASDRLNALPSVDAIKDLLSSQINSVLDANCGALPVTIRTVLNALLTVCGLYILYKCGVVALQLLLLPVECLLTGFTNGSQLFEVFRSFVTNPGDRCDQAQMGSLVDVVDYIPNALALASTLCVTYMTNRIPSRDNTPFGLITKIGAVPRAAGGLMEILKWMKTAVQTSWDWVKVNVFDYDPTMLDSAIPELSKWMIEVETAMYAEALQAQCRTFDGRYAAVQLYAKGHALKVKYADAMTPALRDATTRMLQQALRVKGVVENQYPETKAIRSVPLAVWLVGESQMGKSTLQYLIATELCLSAGIENAKDQLYQRCVEQVYWDGYRNQYVCLYDDFGQMKDTVGTPNLEFFEVIRAIGPFPYPLHMADISQKTNTQFDSRVVIASTNDLNPKIESLTYPDAVWNRLEQSYFVNVKPEYLLQDANGNVIEPMRLNIPKIHADSPVLNGKKWAVNPYIYEFVRFNARTRNARDRRNGHVIEWDEFIARLKDELVARKDRGAALDDFLSDLVKSRRARPPNVAQVGVDDASSLLPPSPSPPSSPPPRPTSPVVDALETVLIQPGPLGSPKFTLADIRRWIETTNPFTDESTPDSTLDHYRLMVRIEMDDARDQDIDPEKAMLVTYEPSMVPNQQWMEILTGFYQHQSRAGGKIQRLFSRIRTLANSAIDALPLSARDLYRYLGGLVLALTSGLVTTFSKYWFPATVIAIILSLTELRRQARPSDPPADLSFSESDTRNHQPRARPQPRTTSTARARLAPKAAAEMGQSYGQLDVIAKVRKQQYLLSAVYDDGKIIECGTITNVVGQVFIMPYHFYLHLLSTTPTTIELVNCANPNVIITKPIASFIGDEVAMLTDDSDQPRDLCMFYIPEFHRGTNVLKHFASTEDLAKMSGRSFNAALSGISLENGLPTATFQSGRCSLLDERAPHSYVSAGANLLTTNVAVHDIPTKAGDCGKVISVNSDVVSGRIFGIHISGNVSGRNHAQVVSREELERCLSLLPSFAQCGHGFNTLKDSQDPFNCGLLHLGKFPTTIPQATRTCIVKSRMHGLVQPPLTRPAVLRPTEVVIDGVKTLKDPLLEGAKKAGLRCGFVDPQILESAEIDVRNLIRSQLRPDGPDLRTLTFEEAVQGIPQDELFCPVNRTTSPGYPYTTQPKPPNFPGKTYWLGKGDEWALDTPQALNLRKDCDELEAQCVNDLPTSVLWIDTLKDERLPHAKVDIAKTRIISNGPMNYNIVFRKYFLSAMAHIRHNRILNGVAIGMNVWSSEWNFLARHLLANSQNLIDGDFTNYDGTLMDQLMWSVFRILDSLYDDGNSNLRRNLWHAACYATRYNQGEIYQCTHSLPSGFPATAEANSLYELLLFRCAYIKLAREAGLPDHANMQSFNKNVRIVTYGDDNLLSIADDVLDWYNMHSLVACMAQFGMTYTTAQKTTDYQRSKTIADVSFLKRYFRVVDTGFGKMPMFTCPAPLETRLDILNWTKFRKLGADPEESDAVTTVLQELSVHGKETYDKYSKLVVDAAISVGITGFIQLSLFEYLTKFTTGCAFPARLPSPLRRDLTSVIQNSDDSKDQSTAVGGRGVAIQPYILGSPEAAPHYPRNHRSET